VLVAFFLTPFVIRCIGAAHYGLYVLLLSLAGFVGIVELGLGEATLRFVAFHHGRGDRDGVERVIGATLSVYALTGLVGWAVLFFGARLFVGLLKVDPESAALAVELTRLVAFAFALGLVSGVFSAIPRALERYDVHAKVLLLHSLIHTSGMIALLALGHGVRELVVWTVATRTLILALHSIVARRLLPGLKLRPQPSKAGLREVFGYGAFALTTKALALVWQHADRILLGVLVGPVSVGYLAVPQEVSFRGLALVTRLSAVLLPRFSSMERGEAMKELFLDATWCMLVITIAIFVPVTVLIPDFLQLWIGEEFAQQSALVGQIIAFGCIFRGAFYPYQMLFSGIGKPQYMTLQTFCSAVLALSLNLILIPRLGLVGAGCASASSVVVGFAAVLFVWFRVLGGGAVRPLLRVVAAPTGCALVALLACQPLRAAELAVTWPSFALQGVAYSAICLTAVLGVERIIGRDHARTRLIREMLSEAKRFCAATGKRREERRRVWEEDQH